MDTPVDSATSTSVGSTKRKRVRQSCQRCRTKRIRCDGVVPHCGTCRAVDAECAWSESKRRGPPPFKQLAARTARLECHLYDIWRLYPTLLIASDSILRCHADGALSAPPAGLPTAINIFTEQAGITVGVSAEKQQRFRRLLVSQIFGDTVYDLDYENSMQVTNEPPMINSGRSGQVHSSVPLPKAFLPSENVGLPDDLFFPDDLLSTSGVSTSDPLTDAQSEAKQIPVTVPFLQSRPAGTSDASAASLSGTVSTSNVAKPLHPTTQPRSYEISSGFHRFHKSTTIQSSELTLFCPVTNTLPNKNPQNRTKVANFFLTYFHPFLPLLDRQTVLRWSFSKAGTEGDMHPALTNAMTVVTAPYMQIENGVAVQYANAAVQVLLASSCSVSLESIQALLLLTVWAWGAGLKSRARDYLACCIAGAVDINIDEDPLSVASSHVEARSRAWHCICIVDFLLATQYGLKCLIPDGKRSVFRINDGREDSEIWQCESARSLASHYAGNWHSPSDASLICSSRALINLDFLSSISCLGMDILTSLRHNDIQRASAAAERSMENVTPALYVDAPPHVLDAHAIRLYLVLLTCREVRHLDDLRQAVYHNASTLLDTRLRLFTCFRSYAWASMLPLGILINAMTDDVAPPATLVALARESLRQYNQLLPRHIDQLDMLCAGRLSPNLTLSPQSFPIPATSYSSGLPSSDDRVTAAGEQIDPLALTLRHFTAPSTTITPQTDSRAWDALLSEPLDGPPAVIGKEWQEIDVLTSLGYLDDPLLQPQSEPYAVSTENLSNMIDAWWQGASFSAASQTQ